MKDLLLHRFCKETGLPKSEVSMEALGLLRGESKDHLKAHNDLKKFYLIRDLAKKKGKSFQDIVDLLNS